MDPQGLPNSGGQPVPTTPPAAGAANDGWGEAEAAYNAEPSGFDDLPNAFPAVKESGAQGPAGAKEQPATPQATEQQAATPEVSKPEAPVDPEGTNLWKADGITTPEQFQDHLKKAQAWTTRKIQEHVQKEREVTEGWQNLSGLVAQILERPESLPEVVAKHGRDLEEIGVKVNWDYFRNGKASPAAKPEAQPTPAEMVASNKDAYIEGVRKSLIGETNDPQAIAFGNRMGEMLFQVENRYQTIIKTLKDEVRNDTLQATEQKLSPFLNKAQHEERTNTWSRGVSEIEATAAADPNFLGFKEATTKTVGADGRETTPLFDFIMSEPHLKSLVLSVNANPAEAARMGWTPAKVLKYAYNNWPQAHEMRTKAIREQTEKDLRQKLLSQGELPGSQTQTIKTGGEDWAQIEADVGDPFRGI